MELRVPLELEAKLNRLAETTGRTTEQLALDLLAASIEHDEEFFIVVNPAFWLRRNGHN